MLKFINGKLTFSSNRRFGKNINIDNYLDEYLDSSNA